MPTLEAFQAIPPFPDNVPTYNLPRLMLSKLISNDLEQSRLMFDTFQEHGFALLDMQDCAEGRTVLEGATKMLEVTREVTLGLNLEEKLKFEVSPPKRFHGYVRFVWHSPAFFYCH